MARSPGTGDDGRLHVRTSSQAPFIVQQKLCHLFGLRTRDLHVFTERVGGGFGGKQEMLTEDLCVLATLQDRPAGEVGVHPRRAVHRRDHAPSDDDARQARRETRRDADRDRYPRRLQHRRLWRPRRRDARRLARQPDGGLPLPQQEGGRLRRLHQHGPGRRLSRLRLVADDLRHRVRDRRTGATARDRPVRDPPQEHDPAQRLDRVGLEGPFRCRASAATGSTSASTSSRRPWSGRRRSKARGRRLAGRHRHRAGDAGLRPADRASLGSRR